MVYVAAEYRNIAVNVCRLQETAEDLLYKMSSTNLEIIQWPLNLSLIKHKNGLFWSFKVCKVSMKNSSFQRSSMHRKTIGLLIDAYQWFMLWLDAEILLQCS